MWRVKHDCELADLKPNRRKANYAIPEVYVLTPDTRMVPMTEAWQWFTFRLFWSGAPHLAEAQAKQQWRSLYAGNRAFTNRQGFNDESRSGRRADFVNGLDLDAPLPMFDKPRVCGGASVTGKAGASHLVVETLDGTKAPPSLDYVLARPWLYFEALSIPAFPDLWPLEPFPQGGGVTRVPLVSAEPVKYPLVMLERLPEGSGPADPYEVD